MPFFRLQTNQILSEDEKTALCNISSECIAQCLEKSEEYVMVTIQSGMTMSFAAQDKPCALVELKSIGLPVEKTSELSLHICEMVQRNIGVAPERIYIEFSDVAREMWGRNCTTF